MNPKRVGLILRFQGRGVCFFGLNEPALCIAGRIIEYLGRTSIHKIFRNVMRHYVWDVICREEVIPFLRRVVKQGKEEG